MPEPTTEQEANALESISTLGDITEEQVLDIFDMQDTKTDKPQGVVEPTSGSIDPSAKDGPEPTDDSPKSDDTIVDDESDKDQKKSDDDGGDDTGDSDDDGDADDAATDDGTGDGSKDEDGQDTGDLAELLDFIPEDLRMEDDPAGSFTNWVENYETLRQEKGTLPEASKYEELEKEHNRQAQELAEKNKVISRLTNAVEGAQAGKPATLPVQQRGAAVAESGVDLAKVGDFSGQEFQHDYFDEPEEAMNERFKAFGAQVATAVSQAQTKAVQDYVVQAMAEQERLREWSDFQRNHPDFNGVLDEMHEVIRRNPALDTTPGGLEVIYSEAKKLRADKFNAVATELENLGFNRRDLQRPVAAKDGTPAKKTEKSEGKDTDTKYKMSDEQKEKLRLLFSRGKPKGKATEGMKKSSGTQKPAAGGPKKRTRQQKKAGDLEPEVAEMIEAIETQGNVIEKDPNAAALEALLR